MFDISYRILKVFLDCYLAGVRNKYAITKYPAILEHEFQFPLFLISNVKTISVICAFGITTVIFILLHAHWFTFWMTMFVLTALFCNWLVKIAHNMTYVSDNIIINAIHNDYIFGYQGVLHYIPMNLLRIIFRFIPFQEWQQFQQNVTNSVNTTAHLLYSNACLHNVQMYGYIY